MDGAGRGERLAQISTQLVQLHARFYGKGPTRAKTHLREDMVVCVLRDGFTTVERTLLDSGNSDAVHQLRHSFQRSVEKEFRSIVEQETGREVIAYMSMIHVDPDLAVELFMLAPETEAGRVVEERAAETDGGPPEAG